MSFLFSYPPIERKAEGEPWHVLCRARITYSIEQMYTNDFLSDRCYSFVQKSFYGKCAGSERSFSSSHSNSVPQLLLLALLNENGRISSHFVHVVSPILPTVFLLSLVGTLRPLSSASFGKHKHVRIACHSSYPLC